MPKSSSYTIKVDPAEWSVGGPVISDKTANSFTLTLPDGRRFRITLLDQDDYTVEELKGERT